MTTAKDWQQVESDYYMQTVRRVPVTGAQDIRLENQGASTSTALRRGPGHARPLASRMVGNLDRPPR